MMFRLFSADLLRKKLQNSKTTGSIEKMVKGNIQNMQKEIHEKLMKLNPS